MRKVAAPWGRGRGVHVLSIYVGLISGGTELLQDSDNAWSVIENKWWVPLHDIVKSPTSPPHILGNGGFATILLDPISDDDESRGGEAGYASPCRSRQPPTRGLNMPRYQTFVWCEHHDENGVHGPLLAVNAAAIVAGYPSYEPGSTRGGHSEHPLKIWPKRRRKVRVLMASKCRMIAAVLSFRSAELKPSHWLQSHNVSGSRGHGTQQQSIQICT
jgi:hypothetical protein